MITSAEDKFNIAVKRIMELCNGKIDLIKTTTSKDTVNEPSYTYNCYSLPDGLYVYKDELNTDIDIFKKSGYYPTKTYLITPNYIKEFGMQTIQSLFKGHVEDSFI